jgi:hypothetical protein
MTIDELKDRHYTANNGSDVCHLEHTELSIEFAISVLEELLLGEKLHWSSMNNKIQELKQYLDEKV